MKSLKRIAIFSYDNPGAKTYNDLIFLINEIKELSEQVIVVTNGSSKKIKDRLPIEYIFIDNVHGFNANRWKRGIDYLRTNDMYDDLDELLLLDDSIFGPLKKIDYIFDKMGENPCDFWGISYHERIEYTEKKRTISVPKHLQTYFLVFKARILKSQEFLNFWKKLPLIRNIEVYQQKFEFCMCSILEEAGFTWDSYIDTKDIDSKDGKSFIDHFILEPYYLLVNKDLPFISRHSFGISREVQLCYHDGSELYRTVEYIKNNTDYNEGFIFDYLIKNFNVYDIKTMLNLTYILSDEYDKSSKPKRAALFVHLYYEDLFEYCIKYISNIPSYVDFYISTDEESKKVEIERILSKSVDNKYNVYVVEKRGREWSAYLMNVYKHMDQYDYIGFIHDKKSSQMYYTSIGRNFCDTLWENVIGHKNSVGEILDIFEDNPMIGVLSAPSIYCGTFFHTSIDFWSICYDKTAKILKMLDLDAPMSKEKNPIAIGTAFWCRTEALKQLFTYKYKYEMFPKEPMDIDGTFSHGLERVIPYVAQANGYATGVVMSRAWALTEISNKNYINNVVLRKLKNNKKSKICLNTLFDLNRTM